MLAIECDCRKPRLWDCELKGTFLGTDMTNSRYGEVWFHQCPHCQVKWLFYRVEYESFSQSGRWFRAIISPYATTDIQPERAEALINASSYKVIGGSFYDSTGKVIEGPSELPFNLV